MLKEKIINMNKSTHKRDAYIWNAIAGIINAGEAVILMLAVTRTTGLEDAGIISISMAVTNLLMTIGKFGIRNMQVADVEKEISFSTYFFNRVITTFIMLGGGIVYVLSGMINRGYSKEKALIMLLICGLYMVETFEDVFAGLYHQRGRLDISAKIFSIRWTCTLITYVFALLIYKNLLKATIIGFCVNLLVMLLLLQITYPYFKDTGSREKKGRQRELFIKAFPLAASAYLSFYIINAPKYAIDTILSDVEQACYGFISMPVFVIGLLNGFIYQPTIIQIAFEWKQKDVKAFKRRIGKQLCCIAVITIVCVALANFWGISVLSLIYETDLSEYKDQLLILLLGGGGLAVSGYLNVILTIMKKQKLMMMEYCIIGGVALLFSQIFVGRYGTMGAAIFYMVLSFSLAIIFGCSVIRYLKIGNCEII